MNDALGHFHRSDGLAAMGYVPTARALGETLLGLYEAARTPDVDAFQEQALEAIARLVPFDASIWGIGTVSVGRTVVSGAHLRNFSNEAILLLNREDARNIVGQAVRDRPGIAHMFSAKDVFRDPGTKYIWDHVGGVEEVLCLGSLDRQSGLLAFIALARHAGGAAFTNAEAEWIEILAPHLEATLQICRVSELQHASSASRPRRSRAAVCDARGVLHVAEPGFAELVSQAWPQWRGPRLPRELIEMVGKPGSQSVRRGTVTVSVAGVAQKRIITAMRRMPIDLLTPQEAVVAKAFAEGRSYKEVARELCRSPATVRHHLRSVYAKLQISDKGALAGAIFNVDG